ILKLSLLAFVQTSFINLGGGIYVVSTGLLGALVFMIGHALANGASVYAVSLVHLERPATIRESYKKVRSMLGRILNVIISVALRSMGVLLLAILVFFTLTF